MPSVLITGADRGLGLSLSRRFAVEGWRVFAGRFLADWPELTGLAAAYPDLVTVVDMDVALEESVRSAAQFVRGRTDRVDIVINNAGVSSDSKDRSIHEEQHYGEMLRLYNVNALGALRVVEAFLPLTQSSDLKRLCFVSSEAGSIERAERPAWFGYCMSKTALNMGVKLLFNALRPEGYTFRLFHPGWMKTYMSGVRSEEAELEPDDVASSAFAYFVRTLDPTDEDRLVMRDWQGNEWPW